MSKSQVSLENAGVFGAEFTEKTKAGDLDSDMSGRPGEQTGLLLWKDSMRIS